MELRVVADEVIQADMEIAYAQARVAAAQRDLEVAQARRQAALLELQQCGYTGEGLHELLETARRDNFLLQAAC